MTAFIEGRKEAHEFNRPGLDTFKPLYRETEIRVTISTDEFTAVCPATNNPDIYDLTINYVPDELCLELKSFKQYLKEYRNWGIFIEDLACMILEDIVSACDPIEAHLTITQARRGGIETTVTRDYDVDDIIDDEDDDEIED